jgi:hypothetical protein
MDEDVFATIVGLDKAIALRRVEPLHFTYGSETPRDGDRNPAKKGANASLA